MRIYRAPGCSTYTADFRGWDRRRIRRSTGVSDRETALIIANEWQKLHALVRGRVLPPEHIEAMEKGRTPLDELVSEQDNNVKAFIAFAELRTASDFAGDRCVAKLERWLREMAHDHDLATKTINKKLWSVQSFSAWLWRRGYITTKAAERVDPLKARGEARKRPHDALMPVDAERLFEGEMGLFYRFRCFTGLRGTEAVQVHRSDLDLGDKPTLTVRAEITKNGYGCQIPIPRLLADKLNNMALGPLFSDVPRDRARRTRLARKHLDAIGCDRRINQLSLRMAYVTWLEIAKVELGVRMKLRRDVGSGSVKLTNTIYSDPKQVMEILRSAVEQMAGWYINDLARARKAAEHA